MFDFRHNRFDLNSDINHAIRAITPLCRGLFHRPLFSCFCNIREDIWSDVHLRKRFDGNRLRVPPESTAATNLFHLAPTTGTSRRIVSHHQRTTLKRMGAQRFLEPLASEILLRARCQRATRDLRAVKLRTCNWFQRFGTRNVSEERRDFGFSLAYAADSPGRVSTRTPAA